MARFVNLESPSGYATVRDITFVRKIRHIWHLAVLAYKSDLN